MGTDGILSSAKCRCGVDLRLMSDGEEVYVECEGCGFEKRFGRGVEVPRRVRKHNAEMAAAEK